MRPLSIVRGVVMSVLRGRNWSIVGYPDDSLPENYREILIDQLHLCFAESPVHDADLNGDGTEKKKHIHFVFAFEGNKSFEQIKEISDLLHAPIPMRVANLRSMVRYLVHADNPEKHQYHWTDIFTAGGFDVESHFQRSYAEYRQIIKDIRKFIIDNHVEEFDLLVDLCAEADLDDWLDVLTCRNTLFFSSYCKSRHFRQREAVKDAQYEEYLEHIRSIAQKAADC